MQARQRYRRLRRICWLLFIGTSAALLISLLAIYLLSQGPQKGRQLVTRSSEETFVSLGEQVPVELSLEPVAVPGAEAMPDDGWRLDVLIGLDNSLTMRFGESGEETAFERIRKVAHALIGATDLTRHQMAIVRLDEDAQVIQGLSRNRPVLERVVRELPQGRSTKVHEGLEAMGRELASIRRQPGALGLAILLTDGRTSAAAAERAARKLAEQPRVFVAPIGIGDAVDDDLLRAISSFPSEYQTGSEVGELTAIYQGWVENMEQLIAVGVEVEESFNTAGLSLEVGNAPGAVVSENRLVWEIPFLTTAPRSLHYTPEAAALGWHGIDEPQGRISLRPVGGEPTTLPIHRKPKVFVGTLLLWLLLLLLPLVFLLPWLFAWWRRWRAAAGPALLPEELAEPEPPWVPDALAALDLDALVRPTQPTLVIGLGGTGRWTLTYLKKAVLETNYGRMPETVRFLLFDTHESELEADTEAVRVGGVELDESEYVLLDEDPAHPAEVLERTRRMRDEPDVEPHLRGWWPAEELSKLPLEQMQISRGTNQRRPLGRMALFLDLEHGVEESRFWSSVRETIATVTAAGGDPTVFIAASAAGGTGSGLAVDAAYMTRRMCHDEGQTGVTINLLLALQNSFASLGDQLGLTGPNAFATLRELDRFLACRERRFPMVYSADGSNPANGRLDSPLLDNCFVFDGEREVRPLSDEHPKRGIFPAMADVIHTFLYTTPGGSFDHELKKKKSVAELEREQSGHGVVSSLGTFVFRLPMYEFLQSFKFRFARELLAELVGAERDEQGQWHLPAPAAEEQAILARQLDDFLRRESAERSPSDLLQTVAEGDPEMLAAILEADRAHKAEDEYVRRHLRNGRRYLAGYWLERLHGDAEAEPEETARRFATTLYVAEQLQRRLDAFREQVRQLGGGSTPRMMERLIAGYQSSVADVFERLSAYRDGFTDPDSLLAALDDEEVRQRSSRQLDTDLLVREYFYDEALEERLYQDHLGEEVRRRNLRQFVWQCRESGDQLALELEVTTTEPRSMPPHDAASGAGAEPVAELAELILQPMWDQEVTPYIEESYPSAPALAEKICEWAAPLVAFDRSKAVRHTFKLFTTLGDDEYGEEVVEQIHPKFARRQHVQRTSFRDPHCLSNVMVLDSLPLPALRPYDQGSRGYHAYPDGSRSQLHVFAAERRAAGLEQELPEVREPRRVFHPRFIAELEDPQRLRLFAECAIYGCIPEALGRSSTILRLELAGGGGESSLLLGRDGTRGVEPLVQALHHFVAGEAAGGEPIPFDRVRDAVALKQRELEDLSALLERRQAELHELSSKLEGAPEHRDLLSYLALVVHGERRRLQATAVRA